MRPSAAAISRWVSSGRLHRIHPGVYAVGHRDSDRDLTLRASGYSVRRYGWRQVTSKRSAVAVDIRRRWGGRAPSDDLGPVRFVVAKP